MSKNVRCEQVLGSEGCEYVVTGEARDDIVEALVEHGTDRHPEVFSPSTEHNALVAMDLAKRVETLIR